MVRKLFIHILIVLILLLGACDPTQLDFFPATLGRTEAISSFRSHAYNAGIKGQFEIKKATLLSSARMKKSYIFLYLEAFDGPALVVLSPTSLDIQAVFRRASASGNAQFGAFLATDDLGYFVSSPSGLAGTGFAYRIDPITVALDTATATPPFISEDSFSLPESTDSIGPSTLIIRFDSSSASPNRVSIKRYRDWQDLSLSPQSSNFFDPLVIYPFPLSQLRLMAVELVEGKPCFLFTAGSQMLTVTFPSVEKLLEGYSSGIAVKAPDVKISEPKYGSMQGDPWLTAKGIVLPRFDRESRFVRYGIETLREIDFLSLEDTEYVRYAFLPDGKKWLFYDERTGDLHLLRTGW